MYVFTMYAGCPKVQNTWRVSIVTNGRLGLRNDQLQALGYSDVTITNYARAIQVFQTTGRRPSLSPESNTQDEDQKDKSRF